MKLLLCSVPFSPSVGGIETVSALLVEQFVAAGHAVTVLTQTPGPPSNGPYALVRRPTLRRLWALVADCDAVVHNQISLRLAWPLLFLTRPWVIAHHNWLDAHGANWLLVAIKRMALRGAQNIAVSRAIADALPLPARVVPNPYANSVFAPLPGVQRQRELLFVGRLVSDKGTDLLLAALALLQPQGLRPRLSIVGDGPQAAALMTQAQQLGLGEQVLFMGALQGAALARVFHAHRLLVVPSVWAEPFGLVALEALACGCMPLVARCGGLVDAAGPGAASFEAGNVQDLARCLASALVIPARPVQPGANAQAHLARHSPARVAQTYLDVIADARRGHRLAASVGGA